MANKFFDQGRATLEKMTPKKSMPSFKEGTIDWGDLPGKTQPKDRSNGIKRLKIHPVSKGL